jgi:MerR family transcriptional regulator, mercuric resistance operon regulatory protein
MAESLSIGALSSRTGVNLETIRYYERIGMLPEPPRTRARHRIYGPEHAARLAFIRRGRELGFTLAEIRSLSNLLEGGSSCAHADAQALARSHIEHIRAKIADLRRIERTLVDASRRCDRGGTADCPIIDVLLTGP